VPRRAAGRARAVLRSRSISTRARADRARAQIGFPVARSTRGCANEVEEAIEVRGVPEPWCAGGAAGGEPATLQPPGTADDEGPSSTSSAREPWPGGRIPGGSRPRSSSPGRAAGTPDLAPRRSAQCGGAQRGAGAPARERVETADEPGQRAVVIAVRVCEMPDADSRASRRRRGVGG
jgi:hypothetical protein